MLRGDGLLYIYNTHTLPYLIWQSSKPPPIVHKRTTLHIIIKKRIIKKNKHNSKA